MKHDEEPQIEWIEGQRHKIVEVGYPQYLAPQIDAPTDAVPGLSRTGRQWELFLTPSDATCRVHLSPNAHAGGARAQGCTQVLRVRLR
jgi:hypothetical protein